ncbi:universal stress protein [Egicoccus sp. AB-alg2]|uniref:universal stress protein n=1 Tax=Egicoccus sp. AB-alg2 TaxID=3242693 RepID=UPI00359D7FEA
MTRTLVVVDDGPGRTATVRAARAVAPVLGTRLAGVHAPPASSPDVEAALAARLGFPVAPLAGDPVAGVLAAIADPDVALAVVGGEDHVGAVSTSPRLAPELARRTTTPLLVVPPRARLGLQGPVRRVLLPLDGRVETTRRCQALTDRFTDAGVDLIALHVFDPAHTPPFLDEACHEVAAWQQEFRARHLRPEHRLELARGATWDSLRRCAEDVGAELLLLGWSRSLAPGRAAVVRSALADRRMPTLLVPDPADRAAGPGPSPLAVAPGPG